MDIDLVYLWCSDSDPDFRGILSKTKADYFIQEDLNHPDVRVTDHNELRYSLRSVEKFAPWIHHIYIVTYNQVPKWLNTNHPKITIVDHSDIIPKQYLPTFNSPLIEAFLHKIPGLSECFLYANDDMFFGNKTEPDFFFDEQKRPIHWINPRVKYVNGYWENILKKAYLLAQKDTQKTINFPAVLPSHNIDPYTKSLYADTVNHFEDVYKEMFPNKFRRNNNVQRFLISCWGYLTNRLIWKEIKQNQEGLNYIASINNKGLDKFLEKKRPNLFCLNDYEGLNETDHHNQTKLLEILFPEKSEFEKDGEIIPSYLKDYTLKPAFDKNNIPIVFTVNENFIPYCKVALASLLKNISNKNNYDIIVLTNGEYKASLKKLIPEKIPANVSVRIQNVRPVMEEHEELFKNFSAEKITKWIKIFLPKIFLNYSKIIYLDADLLIKCDISELWNINLEGKYIGGVFDMAAHHIDSPKKEHMREYFGCDNINDYINLGVIVMDLEKLRQMDFVKKIVDLLHAVPEKVWNLYSLFNAVLHKNIKLLPMVYNYQYGILYKSSSLYQFFKDEDYLTFQKATQKGAKIVHFTAIKPWVKITGPEGDNWRKLADETKIFEHVLSEAKHEEIAFRKQMNELYFARLFQDATNDSSWLKKKSFALFGAAANYSFIYTLFRVLDKTNPMNILELGLGQTTKLTSQYICNKNPKASLTICEDNQEWIDIYKEELPLHNNIKINKLDLESFDYLGTKNIKYKGMEKICGKECYDLIIVDGPIGRNQTFPRSNILDLMKNDLLADDFIIIFDDTERKGETFTVSKTKELLRQKGIDFIEFRRSALKTQTILASTSKSFIQYL